MSEAAPRPVTTEGRATRLVLIAVAVGFLALFLLLPLVAVFVEALRRGVAAYLTALVEPDELEEAARAEATRFTAGSPFAIGETKALLYAGLGRSFDDHVKANREVMERCFRSDDHKEGVASFLERRAPNFTGR